MELKFERETCSRCSGSGNYSYCQSYGTTCFKCHGAKEVLTKRASLAAEWMRQQRRIAAGEVKIGERVQSPGIGKWTVREIKEEAGECKSLQPNGSWKTYTMITLAGKELGLTCSREHMIERWPTKAEAVEQLKAAIEYQNSLTKAGTLRK